MKETLQLLHSKNNPNKMNETLFKNDLWYVYSSETKQEYEKNKTKFIRKWETEEPDDQRRGSLTSFPNLIFTH